MNRFAFVGVVPIFLLCISVLPVWSQVSDHPWPMYQHDPQHTGRSEYVGPQTTEANWISSIVTDSPTYPGSAQPVIGVGGVIYLAVRDNQDASIGKLYAINPDGRNSQAVSYTHLRAHET